MKAHARGLVLDETAGKPISKTMVVLSISNLVSIAALVFSMIAHSTDGNAAMEQRLSAVEATQKTQRDDHKDQLAEEQQFRQHVENKLDTIDGRNIDMYKVVLDIQRQISEKEPRR